jgi:hypothetical protein
VAKPDGRAGETYRCEVCHGVFTRPRSDEEAMTEMRDTWQPCGHDDDPGIVCDDCFAQVMAWARLDAPELLRRPRA